jgi:PAS domain S-box-containing protein
MTGNPSGATADAAHADPRFLLRVLANLNDHFVIFDQDWRYTYINDAAAQMLGLPKEQLLGQCVWELFPETIGNIFYRQVHRAMAEQCDISFEHFYAPWNRWCEHRVYAFPGGVSVLSVDITARKQAEAEAQQKAHAAEEAQRTLEMLLEHVPESITMTGGPPDFPVIAHSKLAQTLLGRPSATLTGMPAGHHVEAFGLYLADGVTQPTPEQAPLYRATHHGETIEDEEWVIRRPDGSSITVLVKVAPIWDSAGQVAGAVSCWHDISERKQMEQALRASEERFSKAFHASPQPMCITCVEDGGYIDVNERFARMVGSPRSEIIGRTSLEIGVWSDPQQRARTNDVILSQGGSQDFEHRFYDRNGNLHEIVSTGQLIELEGQPCILSVVNDVTARKQAEEALRKSEARFRSIFESNMIGIGLWHGDGSVDEANDALLQLLGYTSEDLETQRIRWENLTPPEYLPLEERAMQESRSRGMCTPYEKEYFRKDGSRIPVIVGGAFFDRGGAQGVFFALDISERKAAEERLRLAVEATGLGIWEMLPDRGEITWSAQCKAIHGLPEETEITRELVRETIYPADLEALQSIMSAFYAPPRNHKLDTEHRIVRRDGAVRWIRVQGRFIDDVRDGQLPLRSLGAMLDITEQKRAEEEIAAGRRFLARVAQATPDSLMVYDLLSQRIIFHNPALVKILGLQDEASLAQTQLDIDSRIHPDDLARVQEEFTRLYTAADDDVIEIAFRYQFPNGQYRWLQERTVVFTRDAAGAVTEHLSVSRDITERKEAEQDLSFLAELAERIRLADDAGALIRDVAQAVGEYLQVGRCLFIELDAAADCGVVRGQHCRGLPPVASEYKLSDYSRDCGRELAAGRPLINHDAQLDPRTAAIYETTYAPVHERAYIGIPLLRAGDWRGILSVTCDQPRQWQPREVTLLETVAERTWLAVEKLQLAAELRASEEELRVITDAVPGLIAYVDAEERYQFVNATYEHWFGLTSKRLVGKHVAELLGDGYAAVKPHIDTVLAGRAVTFENEFTYLSGHKTVLATYRPHIDIDGRVLGFYVLITDITERKVAEERLRFMTEATAMLTSSLDYTATLQGVANLMALRLADWCSIDILRPDGTIDLVAVAHVDPAKAAWGRELRRRFPLDRDAPQGLLNVLRTGRSEFYPDIPLEQLLQAAQDEEQRQILAQIPIKSLIIAPLRTRDQVIGAIQLIWADSDRRYTEADLHFAEEFAQRAALAIDNARLYQQARSAAAQLQEFNAVLEQRVAERTAKLESSNRELDQFAYVASHDLKAPLRAISHLATWISEDAQAVLPAASQEHLAKLHRRIKRMEQLLDDLLAYSRAGRMEYPPERVDVAALVKDIIETLAPPSGFTVTVHEPMPTFVTARTPLETTLRNLIANAIKHHDRPDGHVHVTAQDEGDVVTFTVTDDGPGIAPEFHQRIFEMFKTLQPRDQVEGSGVGLAIVKKTVETRGGTIQVESDAGRGANFRFTWPKETTL